MTQSATASASTLLIFGARSTALEMYDLVQLAFQQEFPRVLFVVGNDEEVQAPSDCIRDSEVKAFVRSSQSKGDALRYILSFANQKLRAKCVELMDELRVEATSLIHPRALISPSALVSSGTYIAAHVVVSSNAMIAKHCIVNFNCTVGHDTRIAEHVMMNPGARISGNVSIGERSMIGANALIFQGKCVGKDCVVDALSYVDRDVPDRQICSSKQALQVFRRVVF